MENLADLCDEEMLMAIRMSWRPNKLRGPTSVYKGFSRRNLWQWTNYCSRMIPKIKMRLEVQSTVGSTAKLNELKFINKTINVLCFS